MMTEAIFGLLGVVIGSTLSWLQIYWTRKRDENKNANYLAIRVVCILDKFLEDCANVVNDDGLCYGQRDKNGCLVPQVKAPEPPIFPEDVDWKSIDSGFMYEILSFPSDIISSCKSLDATMEIASPPDYAEWFGERRLLYSKFGTTANRLKEKLCVKYKIRKKNYDR